MRAPKRRQTGPGDCFQVSDGVWIVALMRSRDGRRRTHEFGAVSVASVRVLSRSVREPGG